MNVAFIMGNKEPQTVEANWSISDIERSVDLNMPQAGHTIADIEYSGPNMEVGASVSHMPAPYYITYNIPIFIRAY